MRFAPDPLALLLPLKSSVRNLAARSLLLVGLLPIAAASYVPWCAPTVAPTAMPWDAPFEALWMRPRDLPDRDLFYGPWGRENAPDPRVE